MNKGIYGSNTNKKEEEEEIRGRRKDAGHEFGQHGHV